MSSTQHRCVFVGNIPYDATEEELIRICEEVGPVVSFRLVVDRETGKPKGYGFCEYRDEETALSARRNLQGYEINGRLLRVDFAENEKGSGDRNRDQKGRGGAGLVDLSKQQGGPKGARDHTLFQPIGLPASMSAAAVMANLLGGPQLPAGSMAAAGGGRPPMGIDALTLNLANMSRFQLWEVLNQMKNFIQQNQQQARQVLMQNTQLVKALFQAQIILGCIPQAPLQPLQAQGIQHHPPAMPLQQGMPPQQGQVPMPNGSQLQQGVQQQSQPQRVQNFQFQPPPHLQQQPNARSAPMILPPQPLPPPPTSLGLPPLNLAMQRPQTQMLPHLNAPPLPQQARPLLPPSPQRGVQVAGFQQNPSQQPQLQQMPTNIPYPPPLPNQPPPQVLQVPRTVGDMGVNAGLAQGGIPGMPGLLLPTSGGVAQYGSSIPTTAGLIPPTSGGVTQYSSMPATSAAFTNWSSIAASAGPAVGAPPMTSAMAVTSMPMAFGQSSMNSNQQGVMPQGLGMTQPTEYNGQPHTTQPPEYVQPAVMQPPRQQAASQVSLEPEQQKALLQQVMNLTPEQVSSLPPEQRQQVLDLQQAFRNQII